MSELEFSTERDREVVGEDLQAQATEGTGADNHTSSQEPQRSQRVRKLTEKGQELHDENVRRFTHRFNASYEKWKAIAKDAKQVLSGQCSNNVLHELITKVNNASRDLNVVYEELRHIDIPDHDTRRRVDTCEAVTMSIVKTARGRLDTSQGEEQGGKETDSVIKSAASDKMSIYSHCTRSSTHSRRNSRVASRHSSLSAANRQDAAAEVAANEATLEVLLEQERHVEELKTRG